MNRTALAIKMLTLLQVYGKLKKKEIAKKLEVKERYIIELKNELITAGYNIITESGIDGGYRLGDTMLIQLPELTREEEGALLNLYEEISMSSKPIGSNKAIEAFEKICSGFLPDGEMPAVRNYSLKKRDSTLGAERKCFTILIYAIKNCMKIRASYNSFSRNCGERIIHPYNITSINDYYYLIGYEENSNMYKLYKLIRFESLDIKMEMFKKDSAYDMKIYVDELGGKIMGDEVRLKLRISGPYIKTLNETPYGKNVIITNFDDYIVYETTLRGEFIINEFILKMGEYCEVVKPISLKKELGEKFTRLRNIYVEQESYILRDTQVIIESLMDIKRKEWDTFISNCSLEEVQKWIIQNRMICHRKGVDYIYGCTYVFETEIEMQEFINIITSIKNDMNPSDWHEISDMLSSTENDVGFIKRIKQGQIAESGTRTCCILSIKRYEEHFVSKEKESEEENNCIICNSEEDYEYWFAFQNRKLRSNDEG